MEDNKKMEKESKRPSLLRKGNNGDDNMGNSSTSSSDLDLMKIVQERATSAAATITTSISSNDDDDDDNPSCRLTKKTMTPASTTGAEKKDLPEDETHHHDHYYPVTASCSTDDMEDSSSDVRFLMKVVEKRSASLENSHHSGNNNNNNNNHNSELVSADDNKQPDYSPPQLLQEPRRHSESSLSQPGAFSGVPGEGLIPVHQNSHIHLGAPLPPPADAEAALRKEEGEVEGAISSATVGAVGLGVSDTAGTLAEQQQQEERDEENLVVANPVDPPPPRYQAEEVHLEQQQAIRAKAKKKRDDIRRTWWSVGCVVVVVAMAIAVFLSLAIYLTSAKEVPPHTTEAASITDDSLETRVLRLLSNISSLESFSDPESPQSQALQWALEDLSYNDNNDYRIIQRYILVTFYYSTGGATGKWIHNTNWLDHSQHECQWYTDSHWLPPKVEAAMKLGGQKIHLSNITRSIQDAPCGGNAIGDDPRRTPSDTYKYLVFVNNNLDGTIPSEIFKLTSLRGINLSLNSNLKGSIPDDIGYTLTDLQALAFVRNRFMSGTAIPTSIGLLTDLSDFVIQESPMTGTIPTEISALSNSLQIFFWDFLESNGNGGPGGTIPSELGALTTLEVLQLVGNLTGTIPTELGRMTSTTLMELGSNKYIGGQMPSELGQLTQTN